MKNKSKQNRESSNFHDPSFRLTLSEMKFPRPVINSFFEKYKLESLRIHLQKWLSSTQESELPFFIAFSRDIEKLLEATFIINEDKISGPVDEEGRIIEELDDYIDYPSHIQHYNNFDVGYHFRHHIEGDPLLALAEVFRFSEGDAVKLDLGEWLKAATFTEYHQDRFYESQDIPRLQFFFANFQRLIEALHLLSISHTQTAESLNHTIQEIHFLFLNQEEKRNPFITVKRFCDTFPLKYARAELWQSLEAVVSSDAPLRYGRRDIIYHYEMFLCLLESAYALDAQDERIVNIIQKLSYATT